MGSALATKPVEKKSSAQVRSSSACCEGPQSSAGASAGVPLFLQRGCGCPECAAGLQAKLVVGAVGDVYERQAEQIADAAAGGGTDRATKALATPIQAPSGGSSIPVADSGSPLNPDIRRRVEPALGADLSHVRVHGSPADREVARGLGAQAFTHGSHIWLGPSQNPSDVKLLSHEAAHVVQQGAAPGKAPGIQRREDAQPDNGGLQKIMGDLPKGSSKPADGAKRPKGAARDPEDQPDPAEKARKKSEYQADGQPAVSHANSNRPKLEKAAQGAKKEAQKPKSDKAAADAEKQGAKAKEQGKDKGKDKGKGKGGGKGHAAGGIPIGLQKPAAPPPVQAPKIAMPVDSGGKPLMPDPATDAAIVALAAAAQAMRLQGHVLRERAAQERHNAGVIQANMAKIHHGVTEADEAIAKSEGHLSYRKQVVGQAEGALQVSEQKADMVASQAPDYQSKSAEGKAKTGPMSGEAKDLTGQNKQAEDDDDAGDDSKEEGEKLGKVGSDIDSMDDAITQTGVKAGKLAGEAAKAKTTNTQTKQNIAGTHTTLDQTGAKLTQMTGQTALAQKQLASHAHGPAQMAAQAATLDQQGQAAIHKSIQMEQRLHATQQKYLDGMRAVPRAKQIKPGNGSEPPTLVQRQPDPAAGQPGERIDYNLAGKVSNALPDWLTGEKKQSDQERAEAQAAEKKRREDEVKEIMAQAGGDFSKLSAADKMGIALTLTGRHLFGGVASIGWPDVGKFAQGLVDPRMMLMGAVSGISMVASGVANLFSAEQWAKDPLGNLLKSAADIATGITIVLGSITALAMLIVVVLAIAAFFSFGAAGALIPFFWAIVSTVGGWTIVSAGIALDLNLLLMIKDLIDAATADTAEKLQSESDKVTADAKTAENMALQVVLAEVGEAGGQALMGTEFGQNLAAGLREFGEANGIVKPGAAPVVPEGGAVEPTTTPGSADVAAPPQTDTAATPKTDTAATPKTDTATTPKTDTATTETKAPDATDPAAKPAGDQHIVAEQPAANGRSVRVTEEGECLICNHCDEINAKVHEELATNEVPPAEKAKIEAGLEKVNETADPLEKAKKGVDVQVETTKAVADAKAETNRAIDSSKTQPRLSTSDPVPDKPSVDKPAIPEPDKPVEPAGPTPRPPDPTTVWVHLSDGRIIEFQPGEIPGDPVRGDLVDIPGWGRGRVVGFGEDFPNASDVEVAPARRRGVRPPVTPDQNPALNWGNPDSVPTYGHSFLEHGQGPKVTRGLTGEAGGRGSPQGQWLNNEAAAEIMNARRQGMTGATDIDIPPGLGQVIRRDGSIVPVTRARLVPSANGGYDTSFPIL